MSKKKVAEFVFARYPKSDTVYITSDEQAFFTVEEAESHAPSLKDKKIVTIERTVEDEEDDSPIENLGDGSDMNPFVRTTGEGLVERDYSKYDAPGATTGAEKSPDGSSVAQTYGKQADLERERLEKVAGEKALNDKKTAEDLAAADAKKLAAKKAAEEGTASDEGADGSPEFSMKNTKAELTEAAKGLEITDEMTKQEILGVLYPAES